MEPPKKYIMDKFQDLVQRNFESYCNRHGVEKSASHLVTYMIDQNLIALPYLQKLVILEEYEQLKKQYPYTKTILVDTLAHRFNISARTIWSILKNSQRPRQTPEYTSV